MVRTLACLSALLMSAVATPSLGQTPAPDLRLQVDRGLYLGVGIGRSDTREICNTTGGACSDDDLSANIFAGYQFNRHFAVEAGYVRLGEFSTSGLVGGTPSTFRQETDTFELLAVGRLPFSDRFSLYGKIGMHYYDSDGSASGGLVGSSSDSEAELTLGFGAEWAFTRSIAGRIEWQRYYEVGSGLLGVPKNDIRVWRASGAYRF